MGEKRNERSGNEAGKRLSQQKSRKHVLPVWVEHPYSKWAGMNNSPCCLTLVWTAVAFGSPPHERTDVQPIQACAPTQPDPCSGAAYDDAHFSEVLAASLFLANICTPHCVLGNDAKVFH